jgi:hypothetical protein
MFQIVVTKEDAVEIGKQIIRMAREGNLQAIQILLHSPGILLIQEDKAFDLSGLSKDDLMQLETLIQKAKDNIK